MILLTFSLDIFAQRCPSHGKTATRYLLLFIAVGPNLALPFLVIIYCQTTSQSEPHL